MGDGWCLVLMLMLIVDRKKYGSVRVSTKYRILQTVMIHTRSIRYISHHYFKYWTT
jgi:hypothetical protein